MQSSGSPLLVSTKELDTSIRIYNILYTIFFGYSITCIVIFIAGLYRYNIITTEQTSIYENHSSQQENIYRNQYQERIQRQDSDKEIQLLIQQGTFAFTGNTIVSHNNLASYRGLIMPNSIRIHKSVPIPPLRSFEKGNYTIQDIELYMQHFIYQHPSNNHEPPQPPTLLALPSNINNLSHFFGIQCGMTPLLYHKLCKHNIENMLTSIYIYDIRPYYEEFINILSRLQSRTRYKQQVCAMLQHYIRYTNDTSRKILQLIRVCDEEGQRSFSLLSSFLETQEQLYKDGIQSYVSQHPEINAYKLLSTQQKIFHNLQAGTLHSTLLYSYIEYLKNITNYQDIHPFYIDQAYVFIVDYMQPQLVRIYLRSSGQQREIIQNILDALQETTKGSSTKNTTGIESFVKNKELIQHYNTDITIEQEENREQESTQEYFQRTYSFQGFIAENIQALGENSLRIQGSFNFNKPLIPSMPDTIASTITIQEDQGAFHVQNTYTPSHPEIDTYLTTTLRNNTLSIMNVHNLIEEDRLRISQDNSEILNICSRIRRQLTIRDNAMQECSNTIIKLQTQHPRKQEDIIYTIMHNQGRIQELQSSDSQVTPYITQDLQFNAVSDATISRYINQVLSYKRTDPEKTTIDYGTLTNDQAYIDTKIQEYLKREPIAILEQNGSFLIEIQINSIPFLLGYDITTDTLGPLIFREHRESILDTFSLPLNNENQDTINAFRTNPFLFLSTNYPDFIYALFPDNTYTQRE